VGCRHPRPPAPPGSRRRRPFRVIAYRRSHGTGLLGCDSGFEFAHSVDGGLQVLCTRHGDQLQHCFLHLH